MMPNQDMNANATGRIVGRQAETIAVAISIWDQVVGVLIVSREVVVRWLLDGGLGGEDDVMSQDKNEEE